MTKHTFPFAISRRYCLRFTMHPPCIPLYPFFPENGISLCYTPTRRLHRPINQIDCIQMCSTFSSPEALRLGNVQISIHHVLVAFPTHLSSLSQNILNSPKASFQHQVACGSFRCRGLFFALSTSNPKTVEAFRKPRHSFFLPPCTGKASSDRLVLSAHFVLNLIYSRHG